MNKILTAITFLFLACTISFGQSSYKGLTPGQNTRVDVERVFGRPVKSVSKTLIESKSLIPSSRSMFNIAMIRQPRR